MLNENSKMAYFFRATLYINQLQ